MVGAGGSSDPGAGPGWRWDVALSFAGAQRAYVQQVAEALKPRGVRCFYDADEEIDLWGRYLAEELPVIYGEQAAAVVVFISADYATRDWTRLERRVALSQAVRERREYVLPARFDDTPLPGLLSDMSYVDLRTRSPQEFATMIATKLASLAITGPSPPGKAADLVPVARMAHPPGAVQVEEADPRRLGVHAAISVPGAAEETPPEYVSRDSDVGGSGLRAQMAAAAERGGFVLLVGGSSVGKTRCAVEAVTAVVPDWWLVHPDGPAEVAALAIAPPLRTVVWLDELQRYLGGEHGLTGGVVRALLNAPHPILLIGTLWPDFYIDYTTPPAGSGSDPYAREREVLDLATVVRISPAFSTAEQGRARTVAVRDRRLQIALETAGYGLTQTLAAAPQLVARWEDAQTAHPYGWAVLTAALDITRLGARAPLSTGLLRSAAEDYCTSQQQADAPGDWFEQALAYATTTLHGAAAALSPAGAGMGQVAGYTVADYLLQHATQERRHTRVPASTWNAILSHIRDPADAVRLAYSAEERLLYGCAIALYRHAADTGDTTAAWWLSWLLADHGDLDELRARADTRDPHAAMRLAGLLIKHGDLDELRARADTGHRLAAWRLTILQADPSDRDRRRARVGFGDRFAAWLLTDVLARRLADLLAKRLTDMLAERGDLDELRARADTGDQYAAKRLTDMLADRGDLDELRARADTGDRHAAARLADLLADRGDLDELRARAVTGDESAAERLGDLLTKRGQDQEAGQLRRFGLNVDGSIASN